MQKCINIFEEEKSCNQISYKKLIDMCVYWASEKSPATQLHRASQMKPPKPKNAKKKPVNFI